MKPNTLLANEGLQALTVPEEQTEIKLVMVGGGISVEARVKAAELRRRRIIFAFFQDDFKGGRIPYWHVTLPYHQSYRSTLSMEGLRLWKVI